MTIKIKLQKVNQCIGINFYTGSIRIGDLLSNYEIPVYKPGTSDITRKDSGYQRAAKPNRVGLVSNRISNPLQGMVIPNTEPFVDNVNLNLRETGVEEAYVKPIQKTSGYGDLFEMSYIPAVGKFFVVDGQTRIRGAHQAIRDESQGGKSQLALDIEDTRLQITLTFCNDIFKEAYIFYLINQYSKAIPPDGATRLLFEGMKKNDINFVNEVTRANKEQETESMAVAEKLSQHSRIWAGNIKDFNESSGGKMSIRAVAKTIMPLFKEVKARNKSSIPTEDIVYDVIEAFWVGFQMAYPMLFAPGSAHLYNQLKAGPSEIMMKVLLKIWTLNADLHIKPKPINTTAAATYKPILKKVLSTVSETNPQGTQVSNEDIFRTGKAGSIGQYSNSAAKSQAGDRLNKIVLTHFGLPT